MPPARGGCRRGLPRQRRGSGGDAACAPRAARARRRGRGGRQRVADATIAAVRAADPHATVVESPANLGFGGGCHLGARGPAAPLLLFLNPDAVPAAGCVAALRAAALDHPSWGAWQALVTLADGEHVNTAGNLVHWLGFGWAGGMGQRVADVDGSDREVGFASGAALVVRRDAWDAAAGFDERYFMYGEDLDLSLRLRLAGWAIGSCRRPGSLTTTTSRRATTSGSTSSATAGGRCSATIPARSSRSSRRRCSPSRPRCSWRRRAAAGWAQAARPGRGAALAAGHGAPAPRDPGDAHDPGASFAEQLTSSLDSPYLRDAAHVPGLVALQARRLAASCCGCCGEGPLAHSGAALRPGGSGGSTRQFQLIRRLVRARARRDGRCARPPHPAGRRRAAARDRRAAPGARAPAVAGARGRWRRSAAGPRCSPTSSAGPWSRGRSRSSGRGCATSPARPSADAPRRRARRARLGGGVAADLPPALPRVSRWRTCRGRTTRRGRGRRAAARARPAGRGAAFRASDRRLLEGYDALLAMSEADRAAAAWP